MSDINNIDLIKEGQQYVLPQVAVRLVEEPPLMCAEPLDSAQAVAKVMGGWLRQMDRELVCVVNFQTDLKPINMSICSVGSINTSLVHPREIMKTAILSNAACMMIVHNHPSGLLVPSTQDIMITDRMQQVGELLGIPLMDHIITGRGKEYYSFKEKEILPYKDIDYTQNLNKINIRGRMAAEAAEGGHPDLDKEKQPVRAKSKGRNR